MKAEILVVSNRKMMSDFIRVPAFIHASHANWLPPVYADERQFFNRKKNHAFNHCETIMAVAYAGRKPVGRIMGIVHNTYNKLKNEQTARFSFFDCIEDEELAGDLIEFVTAWAKNQGMGSLIGPFAFSDKDPQGFQIEGFDSTPLLGSNCNLPWLPGFMEKPGFTPLLDCLTYRFSADLALPDTYNRVLRRAENYGRYQLVEFVSRSQLKSYILPVLRLTNETYAGLYGFYPMSEKEMKSLARRYMSILRPEFIKVIASGDEVVAYVIGIPNISAGIIKARGRVLPFGWYHILKSMRNSTQLDLMLGAVKPELQGLGLEVWMGMKVLESAKKAGMTTIATHLILETNHKMRAVIERLDAEQEKHFRIYQKKL
ncbi:MAG: hypothetical protein JNL22_00380 [Bacteroidales bacterium]|nr:hypothetical protein [Bacteroidales bacterium]